MTLNAGLSAIASAINLPPRLITPMTENPGRSMRVLTALASATVTAYALAYITHAEWGLSRIVIREDALGMAGVLGIAIMARIILQRSKRGS
jgi:hypothetical protein